VHIARRQLAQSPGADRRQDRGQDILVLLDRLGRPAVKPFGQPVFGCAPEGVVRAWPDACFEVGTLVGVRPGLPVGGAADVDAAELRPVTASTNTAGPRTIRRFSDSSSAEP